MPDDRKPSGLGKVVATRAAAPAGKASTGLAKLALGRRGETISIPGIGTVRVEILGAVESNEVEAEVYKALAALGLELTVVTAERYELERAWRTLARAVRDPADRGVAFGEPDEWAALDADMINAAWQTYGDVRERLDPLAQPLTEDEQLAIETAAKKGDGQLLRTFGLAKLSASYVSTVARLSTSPLPSSSSSGSYPGS